MSEAAVQINSAHAELLVRCFDFSPPEGWQQIVDSLLTDISRILRDGEVPAGVFSIRQVKEKFGGLRVYACGYPTAPYSPAQDIVRISTADEEDASPPPQSQNWHFEGICSIDFADQIDDTSRARILSAIADSAYVPDAVAQRIRDRIEIARREADRTCQLCGAEGELTVDNGWHITVCAEHRDPEARAAWWKERERQ
jgi:hypothetical protein